MASLAVNAATGGARWPGVLDLLRRHPWESVAALGIAGTLATAVAAWRQERPAAGIGDPPLPPAPEVPEWVVDRAEAVSAIRAVCQRTRRGARTVAITTALEGAGGFGKTVLASVACASPRVRRHFRGRVFIVTIGRDVRGRAAVAAKVAEVTRFITGDTTAFDDPELAGAHLGRLLNQRPRTLLVLDDVWETEQLAPFLQGGRRCVRLVTTRKPALLPPATDRVRVDEMTSPQARAVLTWRLPPLPPQTVADLLEATGRWALLLRLTNRLMAGQIATGAEPAAVAREVLRMLRVSGPAAVDAPPSGEPLDLNSPARRALAVQATVEAATTLLPPGGAQRLAELSVFAEDESVPVTLVAGLWRATSGLTEQQCRALCAELSGLSLISLEPDAGGRIFLHDVLRDYLAEKLGEAHVVRLHEKIVDVAAEQAPHPWRLSDGYLLDHMVAHLAAAGRPTDAESLASDLRWVEARLRQRGPTAPVSDLARAGTAMAEERARYLSGIAHLLSPIDDDARLLVHVLHARLEALPAWQPQVRLRREQDQDLRPYLSHCGPPPDLPDPALLRTLTGAVAPVTAVAVAPDGRWLAVGGTDGKVHRWDPLRGSRTATYDCHDGPVRALAVSPHGDWFATVADDGRACLWDAADGRPQSKWQAHAQPVTALALSADGTGLVTGSQDGTVKMWEVGKTSPVAVLREHEKPVEAVAMAPDGTLVVCGSEVPCQVVRRGARVDHCTLGATSLAFAPDGTWLAYGTAGGSVRIEDLVPGRRHRSLARSATAHAARYPGTASPGPVRALAVSPDGKYLAVAGEDGKEVIVEVFEPRLKNTIMYEPPDSAVYTLFGHTGEVQALAYTPDGRYLISGAADATVRLWEPTRGIRIDQRPDRREDPAVLSVAFSPDGTSIATAGPRGMTTARSDTGRGRFPRGGPTRAVAYSPDGRWIATMNNRGYITLLNARHSNDYEDYGDTLDFDGVDTRRLEAHSTLAFSPDGTLLAVGCDTIVRLWDPRNTRTRQTPVELPGHQGPVRTVAFSPDGSQLAAAGDFGEVWLWDLATRSCTARLSADSTAVHALGYGDNSTGTLATGGDDGTIRLWDTTGTAELSGHTAPVTGLCFAPGGHLLASTSVDGTARVWDVPNGRTVAIVRNEGAMTSCAWAPDGTRLAVGGQRGLYLYDFHR
ncbi:NB-ARC domain-containing protein [Streptomyces regalis]|uniref:NB-ARC domain-containing protein n=1 Tax=Streptomyces regalis TaxID=68262 RepID=UPI00131B6DC6|nr:NB-ARC domain-containing protein [Streptomyces regalis]